MYKSNREDIDTNHIIETENNDCKITICFAKLPNTQLVNNVLENLLDTFERRIKAQTGY